MTYLKKEPICKCCFNKMRIDDIDFNFKGNQDEYWTCDKCKSTLFVKVRYSKVIFVNFDKYNRGGLL